MKGEMNDMKKIVKNIIILLAMVASISCSTATNQNKKSENYPEIYYEDVKSDIENNSGISG